MQALKLMQAVSAMRHINFWVGIYRDGTCLDQPDGCAKYEATIAHELAERGIRWFVAKSHTEQLTAGDVRVAWNDPHPSASAAGLIAGDIFSAIQQMAPTSW